MKLILGDSLEKLKDLPTNTIDACVCDPPYGLAFMNKHWDYDVPSADLWREVYRVLKPGAHLLSFFGTRTYHAGVTRIEEAGFEVRDMLAWLYGSGFPKSLDVSKAIDKAAGAKREVIGSRPLTGNGKTMKGGNFHQAESDTDKIEKQAVFEFTAPATDDAKAWSGWGTALKPANEPIVLARKPLEKGLTVAQNVVKWGTGALAIDASRIGSETRPLMVRTETVVAAKSMSGVSTGATSSGEVTTQGRWPSNVLLDEEAAAMLDEQSGVLTSNSKPGQVKRNKPTSPTAMAGSHGLAQDPNAFYGDSGGASRFFANFKFTKGEMEWLDQHGLGNAKLAESNSNLDEQAMSSALEAVKTNFKSDPRLLRSLASIHDFKKCILLHNLASLAESPESIGTTEIILSLLKSYGSVLPATEENINSASPENNNGPTRFLYQAKASKRERNAGLEGMPVKRNDTHNNPSRMVGSSADKAKAQMDTSGTAGNQNHHPTVKPIKLMEYLVRMITPPGGIVLDPFMGSGTTGCAARKLGYQFIGIEREAEYLEIARKRIEHWATLADCADDSDPDQLTFPEVPA